MRSGITRAACTWRSRSISLIAPNGPTFDGAAIVLSVDDCLESLRSRDLGRIVFEFEGQVEIFPVNYVVEGTAIVFRTRAGTKLAATPSRKVAFEVDSWDAEAGIGWSVIARGNAEEITANPGRATEHLRWLPVHPAAPGPRLHWVAIKAAELTGRRFHVPPTARERT